MMYSKLILILILKCSFKYVFSDVEISAPDAVVLQRNKLEIICRPSHHGPKFVKVNSILLYSNKAAPFSSSVSQIARAYTNIANKTILDLYWTDIRYEITGKTGNPKTAYLKLVVKRENVICEDSAKYRCQMEGITSSGLSMTSIKDKDVAISATETLIYDKMTVYPRSPSTTPYGKYPKNTELTLSCSALVGSVSRELTWCVYMGNLAKGYEYNSVKRTQVKMNKPCSYHLVSEIKLDLNQSNIFTWITCKFGKCSEATEKSNVFAVYTYSRNQEGNPNVEISLSTVVPSRDERDVSTATIIAVISIILVFLFMGLGLIGIWLYKFKGLAESKVFCKNYSRSKSISSVSESCQTENTIELQEDDDPQTEYKTIAFDNRDENTYASLDYEFP